ncbi:hypothetical protein IW262DRAFT_1347924 [Armillaria fumosa]|nr:hypothetical protein IW262DRAFT_1347924 [Armillaria fumosa]
MASEEIFLSLQGDATKVVTLQHSLLGDCLQAVYGPQEPVPGLELKLGRLLRLYPRRVQDRKFITTDINSFELTVAIISSGHFLFNGETSELVRPGAFFVDSIHSLKLPPRCWYHLMINSEVVRSPLDPNNDDPANMFSLHLCSTIIHSFYPSKKGPTQDLDSLLVDFRDSVPYLLDKIYDLVLPMFSDFVKDPSLTEPSLPQSLRVFVAVIKFMLHRLSLPEYDRSYFTIHWLLTTAVEWIPSQVFSTQEATAIMMVLNDILAAYVVPPIDPAPHFRDKIWSTIILAYRTLTTVAPSACSLSGPRSVIDFMTSQWDQMSYLPDATCDVLADLLVKRLPMALLRSLKINVYIFSETICFVKPQFRWLARTSQGFMPCSKDWIELWMPKRFSSTLTISITPTHFLLCALSVSIAYSDTPGSDSRVATVVDIYRLAIYT